MVDPVIQSSLKYFIPSMYSLNYVHTLQQRLVAYSPSLTYYSQIFALKTAKDSSIQFSSTVLYFSNFGVEEDVFFVLLSFFVMLKQEEQLK